jgi:uncharacterized protein with PIN domain
MITISFDLFAKHINDLIPKKPEIVKPIKNYSEKLVCNYCSKLYCRGNRSRHLHTRFCRAARKNLTT